MMTGLRFIEKVSWMKFDGTLEAADGSDVFAQRRLGSAEGSEAAGGRGLTALLRDLLGLR